MISGVLKKYLSAALALMFLFSADAVGGGSPCSILFHKKGRVATSYGPSRLVQTLGKTYLATVVDFAHLPYIFKEGGLISGKKAQSKYGGHGLDDRVYGRSWHGLGMTPKRSEENFGRFWFDVIFSTVIGKSYSRLPFDTVNEVTLYFDLELLGRADARSNPFWSGNDTSGVSFREDPVAFIENLSRHAIHEITFKRKIPLKYLRAIVVPWGSRRQYPVTVRGSFSPHDEVMQLLDRVRRPPPEEFEAWGDLVIESKTMYPEIELVPAP